MLPSLIELYESYPKQNFGASLCKIGEKEYYRFAPYYIPEEYTREYNLSRFRYRIEKKIIELLKNGKHQIRLWKDLDSNSKYLLLLTLDAPSHRSILLWDGLDPMFFLHYSHLYNV